MSSETLRIAKNLLEKKSVTPIDDGAIDYLVVELKSLGFDCKILKFSEKDHEEVINLYAKYGNSEKNLCFAGHTDVVPAGDGWSNNPFKPVEKEGKLYARGVVDMKGAIACFVVAVKNFLNENPNFKDSISFLITGDEEGIAVNGTKKVVDWLKNENEKISHTIVGEPTNPQHVGEMVKVGRRGSVNFEIEVEGKQGHVAYPENAINPVTSILKFLNILTDHKFDRGNEFFDPTNLEVTTIDVGNTATNVIPQKASAKFNIRFSSEYQSDILIKFIKEIAEKTLNKYELNYRVSGESFFNRDSFFTEKVTTAITKITKKAPVKSTSGGTSDARFIKEICPTVEFGLVNKTAHQIDEHIEISELEKLTKIYQQIITDYFA